LFATTSASRSFASASTRNRSSIRSRGAGCVSANTATIWSTFATITLAPKRPPPRGPGQLRLPLRHRFDGVGAILVTADLDPVTHHHRVPRPLLLLETTS
jgi:hypothetical protein